MDRAQILRAFNDHFREFVDDVLRVFPDDRELRTTATALAAARKANPRLILRVFQERVAGPYRKEIEAGDPAFFVDKNWSGDVSDSPGFVARGAVLKKIDQMRESVRSMNSDDKRKSVTYIQNLLRIGDLYESTQPKSS